MKLQSIIAHYLLSGQSQKIAAAQVLQLKPTEITNIHSRDLLAFRINQLYYVFHFRCKMKFSSPIEPYVQLMGCRYSVLNSALLYFSPPSYTIHAPPHHHYEQPLISVSVVCFPSTSTICFLGPPLLLLHGQIPVEEKS